MVSEEHITAFGWATPQEIDDIMALAIRVNDFLSGVFLGVGIRLVDFKMETGRLWENDMMRIVVADLRPPHSGRGPGKGSQLPGTGSGHRSRGTRSGGHPHARR